MYSLLKFYAFNIQNDQLQIHYKSFIYFLVVRTNHFRITVLFDTISLQLVQDIANLRLMRTLVERSYEKSYVLISIHSNILAVKILIQIKTIYCSFDSRFIHRVIHSESMQRF